jgi:hypothetical protein
VYRFPVLEILSAVGLICFLIGQSGGEATAQTAATVQIYVVNQEVVCGGHIYEDFVPCPKLTSDDVDRVTNTPRPRLAPRQEVEVSAPRMPALDVKFKGDLLGDATSYILHLKDYHRDEQAALVVFRWKSPIPDHVSITLINRASGKRICWIDPTSKKSICSFDRQVQSSFFAYHYAFELISNADLQIETSKPNSVFSFGQ